jgi:DNA-binding XRE family transcriptional regulator
MVHVQDVQVQEGDGYKLRVRFTDGTRRVVDCEPLLARRPFQKLKQRAVFDAAFVEGGTVAWPGDIDIAPETLYAMAHRLPMPETAERASANEFLVSLREMRDDQDVSQAEIAEEMDLTQSALSQFERGEDRKLSTLQRYVAALGGQLELVACIGDKRYKLRGV